MTVVYVGVVNVICTISRIGNFNVNDLCSFTMLPKQ